VLNERSLQRHLQRTSPTITIGALTFRWTRITPVPRMTQPSAYGTIVPVPHVGGFASPLRTSRRLKPRSPRRLTGPHSTVCPPSCAARRLGVRQTWRTGRCRFWSRVLATLQAHHQRLHTCGWSSGRDRHSQVAAPCRGVQRDQYAELWLPDFNFGSTGFGSISSTGNSIPRQMQFGVKYLF